MRFLSIDSALVILATGQYINKDRKTTIVAQAICDTNRRVWDLSVGRPGTNNDITVAERCVLEILHCNMSQCAIQEYQLFLCFVSITYTYPIADLILYMT